MMRVGVFDSGVGGLSIVSALRQAVPHIAIRYFADTAFAPYGLRSDAQIIERTEYCCAQLLQQPLDALVVACNTATASAIDTLRGWSPVPVIGVEPGLKPAAALSVSGRIGVLATAATLKSRRYADLRDRVLAERPGLFVAEACGTGWVELVEAGNLHSNSARLCVREALRPLLDAGCDTLVLGCTHYPFLGALIAEESGGLPLVETGAAIARQLLRVVTTDEPANAPLAAGKLDLLSSAEVHKLEALANTLLGNTSGLIENPGR